MRYCKKSGNLVLLVVCCLILTACSGAAIQTDAESSDFQKSQDQPFEAASIEELPEYTGEPYCVLNDNIPYFSEEDISGEAFEQYAKLDDLGRCGMAYANICPEIMPTEERESIGKVKPSGWHTVKYDFVDGKYLYNRCHLIGYQLSGENANERNLITGTRYMNVEGMLPFENLVADYVKETGNHVLYRVTPVFEGQNLLAEGVQMEAMSVEDKGEGILYNVFVYNVQPGVEIDYTDGQSSLAVLPEDAVSISEGEIRGNSRSKIYHCPGQRDYEKMADSKYLVIFQTEQEAAAAGYRKAKR